MPWHATILSSPNSESTMPYMNIKTCLISLLLHIHLIKFQQALNDLQLEATATTNIIFQLLHSNNNYCILLKPY